MKVKKSFIAACIFTIALFYIASPWILERTFFLNEWLSLFGFLLLAHKKFRIGNDPISISLVLLLLWCGVHAVSSLFRMDAFYYYLRNTVIVYSIFSFFIGYYCLRYLSGYVRKIQPALKMYIAAFMIFPSNVFFERFGMATVFPALFWQKVSPKALLLLILLTIVYGIVYSSSTIIILAAFFIFIGLCPGFRFFKWSLLIAGAAFTAVFIYLLPYLDLIEGYSPFRYNHVYKVIHAHPLLSLDPNNTWRLIFWKQVLVDRFPGNLAGLGLGTPVMQYFPVEDLNKLDTLPYVFGAHNSFIYLFGRLGIPYLAFVGIVYATVFKEYFHHKKYYYNNKGILLFWSFFAISVTALFNPVLESPIYASVYWMVLGFLAKTIHTRRTNLLKSATLENIICT